MTGKEFQTKIEEVRGGKEHYGNDSESLSYNVIGLGGEVGEFLNVVKKSMRPGSPDRRPQQRDELANVLFYVARCATILKFDLDDLFQRQIDICREKNSA